MSSLSNSVSQSVNVVTNSVFSIANEPAVWMSLLAAFVVSKDPALPTAIITALCVPLSKVAILAPIATLLKSNVVFFQSLVVMSPLLAVAPVRQRNVAMLLMCAISAFTVPSVYQSVVATMTYRIVLRLRSDFSKMLVIAVAAFLFVMPTTETGKANVAFMSMQNFVGDDMFTRITRCRDTCESQGYTDPNCVPCCVRPWLLTCRDDSNPLLNGTDYDQWCASACYGLPAKSCGDCCSSGDPQSPPCL